MGIAVCWDIFLSFVWNPCFLSCFLYYSSK